MGACGVRSAGEGTGGSGLRQRELSAGGIEIENLSVTSPLDGGFKLTFRFLFTEMFVQQILKKLGGKRAIGFGLQRLLHLPQQRNVIQRRFPENRFALLNITDRKRAS